MKNIFKATLTVVFVTYLASGTMAGNKERAGEAGATELLINPWTRSAGIGGANIASARGLESMNLNVANLAFTPKTEFIFSHTDWLAGADISIDAFGFSQKVGETGVVGVSIMSLTFGEVEVTTVDLPDGGVGTFKPFYLNIGMSYAKKFSNSISGGLTFKIISESISNVTAQGMAIDAGVNYVTGQYDQIKFGIALRNVGPPMVYRGSGLSFDATTQDETTLTAEQKATKFEIPSLVNIGASYDLFPDGRPDSATGTMVASHRVTPSATFTSNSFTKDQIRAGAEYAFKEMFMARFGYVFESEIADDDLSTNALKGLTAGATVEVGMSKNNNSTFGIDYAWRQSKNFSGIHSIGIRFNL